MASDSGTLSIDTAGTREKFSADLATDSAIRPATRVSSISFQAPIANSGNVYVGVLGRDASTGTVSSTYGWTLAPGDSVTLNNFNEVFSNFQGDAAVNGEDIEWLATFEAGSQKKAAG